MLLAVGPKGAKFPENAVRATFAPVQSGLHGFLLELQSFIYSLR